MQILGNQGDSLLTGWIYDGATYYTNDEIGFQRYANDCLIAQAAGLTEIFHAPIYRMQEKWGDIAVERLDQILNNATKQTFNIQVPFGFPDWDYLFDIVPNFNRIPFCILVLAGIFLGLLLTIRRSKKTK
jgi:hypothetical protein